MNWFIGVPLADGAALLEALPPPPPSTKLLHPADLHLTVVFLGAVGEARARVAFEAVTWSPACLSATLGEVVAMGEIDRFSALSARLDEGRAEVEASMRTARAIACAAAGIEPERRAPLAHVTLARVGSRASGSDRSRAIAWAAGLDLARRVIALDTIALFTGAAQGASERYRAVAERSTRG